MFEDQGYDEGTYDVGQVCLNGHAITNVLQLHPERGQKFCSKCGAQTFFACVGCNALIRGHRHDVMYSIWEDDCVPHFCYDCGKPYPWTAAKLDAAQTMVDELDELTGAEREALKKSIDQIAVDGPMTEVAVTKFKKIMLKTTKESAGAMRRLVVDIAGKTASEMLKGGQ